MRKYIPNLGIAFLLLDFSYAIKRDWVAVMGLSRDTHRCSDCGLEKASLAGQFSDRGGFKIRESISPLSFSKARLIFFKKNTGPFAWYPAKYNREAVDGRMAATDKMGCIKFILIVQDGLKHGVHVISAWLGARLQSTHTGISYILHCVGGYIVADSNHATSYWVAPPAALTRLARA